MPSRRLELLGFIIVAGLCSTGCTMTNSGGVEWWSPGRPLTQRDFGVLPARSIANPGGSNTNTATVDWQWYNPASMIRSASNNANSQFQQRLAMDRHIAELPYKGMTKADEAAQGNAVWGRNNVTEAQKSQNAIQTIQANAQMKQADAQQFGRSMSKTQ